jgi:cytochrome c oxidase subunit I
MPWPSTLILMSTPNFPAHIFRERPFRRELWLWSMLAVSSLAIAGVFALLLALSRIPGVQDVFSWPVDFFHKGLVIHVVFSFIVWFLSVFGALLQLAAIEISGGAPRNKSLGIIGAYFVAASFGPLFAPALMDQTEASLNNYIPVIADPIYYGGLIFLGFGVALSVARLLLNLTHRTGPLSPFSFILSVAGVIYLIALICIGVAAVSLAGGEATLSYDFNETLFWGGGHALQFVNVLMMLAAWQVLGAMFLGGASFAAIPFKAAAALLLLFSIPMPLLYFFDPDIQKSIFTDLQYALAPASIVAALGCVFALARTKRSLKEPLFLCLFLSLVVFGVGGFLGLFVDGLDTRTPAHYHGVIAGVTLSFMGLFYGLLLPLMDRTVGFAKKVFWQILLFGVGQTIASIGLFLAGGYGVPRKTAGEAQGLEDLGAVFGMYLNGIGAVIAAIGGILFIWSVSVALLQSKGKQVSA